MKISNQRMTRWGGALVLVAGIVSLMAAESETSGERIKEIRQRVRPALQAAVEKAGFTFGAPIFLRIFKESSELELWMQETDKETLKLYATWKIATYGGRGLGPKVKEGDGMAPEGFYAVGKKAFNPNSSYHLSFNVGYPNAHDRALGRTGSHIMVHGAEVSIGCFAMTDAVIEEIYLLAEEALQGGQPFFRVHSFPFRMTEERMKAAAKSEWLEFWQDLKSGYDAFEETKIPPEIDVEGMRYKVRSAE